MGRTAKFVLASATVGAAGLVGREMRTWTRNPDPTDGSLELPSGESIHRLGDGDASLHAHRSGDPDGPTIVLVHGLIEDARFWAPVARPLAAEGHDVIVVDQRGHGRSERGDVPWSAAQLGADLLGWLETLDVRDAVVGGHSMGGVAAMAMAGLHPAATRSRVAHLVLASTQAGPTTRVGLPDIPLSPARTTAVVHRALAIGDPALAVGPLGRLACRRFFGSWPSLTGLEATRVGLHRTEARTRAEAMSMFPHLDLRAHLPAIDVPATVMVGSRDRLTPRAYSEEIVELLPGARLEVLDGMGHQLTFEAPAELAAQLRAATAVPAPR